MGINKYSIIGYNEGAKVAMFMAIRYPSEVLSMVLIGITYYMSNRNISALKSMKEVASWPKSRLENYLKAYESKDEIQKQWNRYVQFAEFHNQYFPEDLFKGKYRSVKCPVLVVHGDKVRLLL